MPPDAPLVHVQRCSVASLMCLRLNDVNFLAMLKGYRGNWFATKTAVQRDDWIAVDTWHGASTSWRPLAWERWGIAPEPAEAPSVRERIRTAHWFLAAPRPS